MSLYGKKIALKFIIFGTVACILLASFASNINTVKHVKNAMLFASTTIAATAATVVDPKSKSSHQKPPPTTNSLPTLDELLSTTKPYSPTCPPGMIRMNVSYTSPSAGTRRMTSNLTSTNTTSVAAPPSRRHFIPKIIHMTSKSSCLTSDFVKNIQIWYDRFPGYTFYFHDEAVVDRLLYMKLSNDTFPQLHETTWCARGATKSDLWRYLVLWYYGGIYTDLDNTPTAGFDELLVSSLQDYDAFFPLEGSGVLTQYFMSSSPYHPLMNYTLTNAIRSLRGTFNVINNNPAGNTGPRALKNGMIIFLTSVGIPSNGYFDHGSTYTGPYNRTITIGGSKGNPHEFINRAGVSQKIKLQQYQRMNMTHFHNWKKFKAVHKVTRKIMSCQDYITDVMDLLAKQKHDKNTTLTTATTSSSPENPTPDTSIPLPETLYDIIGRGQ